MWLWGTGDLHITFTWRHGGGGQKYGGTFEGIIPATAVEHRNGQKQHAAPAAGKVHARARLRRVATAQRLNEQARAVTLATRHPDVRRPARPLAARSLHAGHFRRGQILSASWIWTTRGQMIAAEVLKEIRGRLGFLLNVGLDYLTLDRTAPTLSGGESQRIRLAGQIGCGLVGVLYILDEPSIGLHPRDNDRLLDTLDAAARPGQHGRRGRARRRHDAGGRSHHRLRARARASAAAKSWPAARPTRSPRDQRSLTGQYLSGHAADRHSRPAPAAAARTG